MRIGCAPENTEGPLSPAESAAQRTISLPPNRTDPGVREHIWRESALPAATVIDHLNLIAPGNGGNLIVLIKSKVTMNANGVVTVDIDDVKAACHGFESYHFVVDNDGVAAHELMIMEPMESGMMDMEEMDELALFVVEEDDLEPGATFEFDYTFPADSVGMPLEFACHIPGHYEAGMHLAITVEE